MSSKILLPQLVSLLAAATDTPKKNAEAFLKAYFATITQALGSHDSIKLKDLGTFKISRVEARKSVNIYTGGEVRIPPHYKVAFTPAKPLAEKVNKEFGWLEIVEIADNMERGELDQLPEENVIEEAVSETIWIEEDVPETIIMEDEKTEEESPDEKFIMEEIPKTTLLEEPPLTETPTAMREEEKVEEEEKKSEELGERLEQDFGIPEPSEPFGPIEPDEPEPDKPITEDLHHASSPAHLEEPQTRQNSMAEREFDPYKLEPVVREDDRRNSVIFVTKEDLEAYATKSDYRVLVKNIKRIKSNISQLEDSSRESRRKTVLWCLILCTLLVTGGFFLTYWLLLNRFTEWNVREAEKIETVIEEDRGDEEYIPVTVSPNAEGAEISSSTESAADESIPASPSDGSDIIAMDKVTQTRYLTTMAKDHYGNYNFWPYIYLENESKLDHPDRVKPGTVIAIPNLKKYAIDPKNPKDIDKAKKLGIEISKKYLQ